MKYNLNIHHRTSIRLKGFDYSQNGSYFVTICVQNRKNRLGEIKNGVMYVNDAGKMVDKWWTKLFEKFPEIIIDEYVIMPNHFHAIIHSVGAIPCNRPVTFPNQGENTVSPLQGWGISNTYNGLGRYISWFKQMSTNEYIRNVRQNNWDPFDRRIWQRNYYEHVIRNEENLYNIREYIRTNPKNWEKDDLYV